MFLGSGQTELHRGTSDALNTDLARVCSLVSILLYLGQSHHHVVDSNKQKLESLKS